MSSTNKKSKTKFSKKIVIACISFIILYTIAQTVLSYLLMIELSPTLTTCVYAFFGTELASVAVIRIFDREDREEMNELSEESENESSDDTPVG